MYYRDTAHYNNNNLFIVKITIYNRISILKTYHIHNTFLSFERKKCSIHPSVIYYVGLI